MASTHDEVQMENWNNLRVRILDAHPGRRPKPDILVSLDKEFKQLARGLLKLQVSASSYKIIGVNPHPLTRGYIMAKSRDGHVVNIYERDYELFQRWANLPDEDRLISKPKHLHGYRLRTVQPDVKKPRTTNSDKERLNIRHGENE